MGPILPGAVEVEKYQVVWNALNGGLVRFKLVGGYPWTNWQRVSSADLAAIQLIFNERPVFFNRQTQNLHTGEEPTGE